MAYSGIFKPNNIHKYIGNWSKIKWRSKWEYTFLKHLDTNPLVKRYSYETVIIPYRSLADGNKVRRYYMDFYVEYESGMKACIEIKPFLETQKPSPPKRLTEKSKVNFRKSVYTYQVNQDKWKAARAFCNGKGWKFFILTEKNCKSLGLIF